MLNSAFALCSATHAAGTHIYLCIAGETEPIIQHCLSQWRTFSRTFSASGLFQSSSQVCSLRLPMTSLSFVPLHGMTSPYGSMKNVSKDISHGRSLGCP